MSPKARRVLWWVAGTMGLLTLGCMNLVICVPAVLTDGIVVHECPSGDPVPTLSAYVSGVGREVSGAVVVHAIAHYTTGDSDEDRRADIHRFSSDLFLVDAAGVETPLKPDDGWDSVGAGEQAMVKLPPVADGDYLLRIKADTAVGDATLDVPLPVYAPARIHVLTDRPLYEPGNTVKFRALALRARDLSPLDQRPGTWTVLDPNGELMLEEKAPAGAWGVAAASFPLDRGAVSGDWTVRWSSGASVGESRFRVEPFTLPRFRVEARADKEAWFIGERPVVRGRVVYSSGAPVANAALELDWGMDGAWPAPTRWLDETSDGHLPLRVVTGADGDFTLTLPVVPADLIGQATLRARIAATDATGDRVDGAVAVLLSQDRILASAVTELADGLAEGFNNRLYLRVTSASGAPLGDMAVRVKRAWDATDAGVLTKTDVDGVASLQLDPGPAVNVLVPAQPVRPPRPPPPVQRDDARDLFTGASPDLADVLALDQWNSRLEGCARWVVGSDQQVRLVARFDASGVAKTVSAAGDDGLNRCVAAAARGLRISSGGARLIALQWTLRDPRTPWISLASVSSPFSEPPGLRAALEQAALASRSCLPENLDGAPLPFLIEWRAAPGTRRLETSFTPDPDGDPQPGSACVEQAMRATLSGEVLSDAPSGEAARAVGLARFSSHRAARDGEEAKPQPTVMLGYELRITGLDSEDRPLGETLLRLGPGSVPTLRLRPDKVLPRAGDTVTVELLRGPGFSGELPEHLYLTHPEREALKATVDQKARAVSFTLPDDAEGWFSVDWMGASARVFVRSERALDVSVRAERPRYAPGQQATLQVKTTAGGAPVSAGVGLFGVDESLGQLAPLLGADALDGLRSTVSTSTPAFGVLDGAALSMGRVRGANAAAATVLRVTQLPTAQSLDAVIQASGDGAFSPVEALTDSFYAALGELYSQTRAWEDAAREGELMSPERMAKLWDTALDAVEKRGVPVVDAYGRRLRLHQLPGDMLALTDPRAVVLDSTHLTEDVEDWARWVAEEQP